MSKNPPPQQTNNQRNEYIPAFIAQKPFYLDDQSEADYLKHQRNQATPQDTLDKAKWYDRGRKSGPAATKYRKGACENCGALTHKTKECLSRPRKSGAKWTGKNIQADEVVDKVSLGWDAKRDRWNGYDAREYDAVIQDYQDLEALKAATASPRAKSGNVEEGNQDSDDVNDADRYAEETDMGRSQPTSTRQLRLREDTAKYLVNLDLESARYDPKTRSMDTTAQSLNDQSGNGDIASEGFVRPSNSSDDAAAFERAQRYAWETQESTAPTNGHISHNDSAATKKLHLQANPTEGELLMKRAQAESAAKKQTTRETLLAKYGGAEYLNSSNSSIPTQKNPILPSQITSSSTYIEYDPDTGKPKNAPQVPKTVARSKYAEDVLTNNHSSVWGSWWSDFQWGYACCHSTTKNSYCTGEEGKLAWEEEARQRTGRTLLIEGTASGNDAIKDMGDGGREVLKRSHELTSSDLDSQKRIRVEAAS